MWNPAMGQGTGVIRKRLRSWSPVHDVFAIPLYQRPQTECGDKDDGPAHRRQSANCQRRLPNRQTFSGPAREIPPVLLDMKNGHLCLGANSCRICFAATP